MLGFWLCLFTRYSLVWGLCLLLCGVVFVIMWGCVCYCVGVVFVIVWVVFVIVGVVFVIVIFVWFKFKNVIWDKVGVVWGWKFIRCCLYQFEIGASVLTFLVCQHCVWSALNMWTVIAVLLSEENVWEQKVGGLKELGGRVWVGLWWK